MNISGKIFFRLLHLISGAAAAWMLVTAAIVFNMPTVVVLLFSAAVIALFCGSIIKKNLLIPLLAAEISFAIFFMTLSPQKQFENCIFKKEFAVKPEINFLPDGKFEVINFRQHIYRSPEDYDEVFLKKTFDPAKIQSVDIAFVYWGYDSFVAHNMLNFKFSDGQELAVSVEPRTPVGVGRDPFSCLCKQQELLFVIGSPDDLFDLRSDFRGEDLYVYQTAFSPEEAAIILDHIIKRTAALQKNPEFYNLITDNCLTAWLPAFQAARPACRYDIRVIFNGLADRMFFDNGILERRNGESFESLKSRSFIKGKSQGRL
jgi:hypothetical protein